jgi:iron donor protein CyaY
MGPARLSGRKATPGTFTPLALMVYLGCGDMTDQEFQTRADQALTTLYRKLVAASSDYEFEPDFNAGALTVEFDEPKAKFVVSPNSPVRQIWISAHSKSYKLDWNDGEHAFVLADSGETLVDFMATAISQHLGEPVLL